MPGRATLALILAGLGAAPALAAPGAEPLVTTRPDSWRSATVFTCAAWKDLLFFGGGAGADGGDPRHEIEIGVLRLGDDGGFHPDNPIITRTQFDLDRPGRGITPLAIVEHRRRLFMFCTARPAADLQPHLVVIEAAVDDPFTWRGLATVIGPELTGEANHHGAATLIDPDDPERLLVYFAARTPPAEYRILLAEVPLDRIKESAAYRLVRDFDSPVLERDGAKANYPFVRHDREHDEFELWYSGHAIDDPSTRASFVTRSRDPRRFEPATRAAIEPARGSDRDDAAYATGPKVHDGFLYHSGRPRARGPYRAIFRQPLPEAPGTEPTPP